MQLVSPQDYYFGHINSYRHSNHYSYTISEHLEDDGETHEYIHNDGMLKDHFDEYNEYQYKVILELFELFFDVSFREFDS